jgi:hypothetical protein
MKAYKLFRFRKDKTIGSLFINRSAVLPIGKWLAAEDCPTEGYKHRPGWHCLPQPVAPHLTERGRQWFVVNIRGVTEEHRPDKQGGTWLLAKEMKIVRALRNDYA